MSLGKAQQQEVKLQIRWLIRRDMAEVLRIERASFEYTWNEEDFLRCLRQRNCIGMVAEQDHEIVGFMIYELHKSRLHILNFSVAGDYRRRDVGGQMVEKLIGKLSAQRRTRIMLEVRETNLSRLLCGAARRVSLNDEEFRVGRVFLLAVRELSGQRKAIESALASGQLSSFSRRIARPRRIDRL